MFILNNFAKYEKSIKIPTENLLSKVTMKH